MLAACHCGMPESAVQTHADCLKLMKCTIKTVCGISNSNFHDTTFEPLFGTGQGSRASPSVWLTLVVMLINTLDRWNQNACLSSHQIHHWDMTIDAFVDDTLLGFTNHGLITLQIIIATLNHIAQTCKTSWSTLVAPSTFQNAHG